MSGIRMPLSISWRRQSCSSAAMLPRHHTHCSLNVMLAEERNEMSAGAAGRTARVLLVVSLAIFVRHQIASICLVAVSPSASAPAGALNSHTRAGTTPAATTSPMGASSFERRERRERRTDERTEEDTEELGKIA